MLVYEGYIDTLHFLDYSGDIWTTVSSNGSSGHPADNSPQFGMLLSAVKHLLEPNRSRTQITPLVPEASVQTPTLDATEIPPFLYISRQPKRFTDVFVNNLDLPPEIVTPPIEATLYPSWLQYRAKYQKRYVDVQQSPSTTPPSVPTILIEATQVPQWLFYPRQPQRMVEGFNPFLPPLLRTCEITTLFTTNYRRANPKPMMPVAKITRIYRVKGLVEC